MPTIPERWLPYVKAVANKTVPGSALKARAQREVDAHRASEARVRAKAEPRKRVEKETKQARRERIAAIRAEVFLLAGWNCEARLNWAHGPATDLHHILSGAGRQRREATDNCVALCRLCHAEANASPVLSILLKIPRLSTEARLALQRRIDKLRTTP